MNPVIFKPSPESSQQTDADVPPSQQLKQLKRDLTRSVRMYRTIAITVGAIVFALLLTFGLQRAPYYETSSLIYVQPAKAKLITDATGGTYDPTRYDTYIQQQLQTIVRSDILADALKSVAPGMWTRPGESEQSAITRLQHDLKVEREMGSYQLSIALSGGNPYGIANVVNAVTNAYIRKERVDELAQTQQQLEVLLNEQKRLQTLLVSGRQSQAGLSTSLGVADTAGDNGNPYDAQLGELRTQLASARSAHAIAEAQLASVISHGPDSAAALKAASSELISNDPGLAMLKQSIAARRSKIVGEMAGLTTKNPLYQQDQEELQRLDQSLDSMTGQLREKAALQLQEKLKLESARTADIVSRLDSQLSQQTSIATGATPKLQQAADIAAQISRLQDQLTEVENAIAAIRLENQSTGLVHLLLPAEVPLKPIPSKKLIILGASLPLAIILGLFASWIRLKLDPHVYVGNDVEKTLGFPPMAVLPKVNEVDPRVLDEFMLRLVAGLDQAHSTSGARTYVFTAASPHIEIEGLLTNLAAKMDKLGYRTLIMKASSALQRLSLASDSDDDGEESWEHLRLSESRATETRLARSGESQLTRPRRESFVAENIERLKQNVDLLFIEALPLSTSTEAEFAARLADITVVIVGSALSTKDDLTETLAVMQRLNVAGVATVLNDMSLQHADDGFIAMVRSVEGRRPTAKGRTDASTMRDTYPLKVYDEIYSDKTDKASSEL
ncbi:MAG: hypothetical protein PW789_01040 [Edaphobacter sp.]|uniref:GumC family protein n=1 Tax=Edaphobacter sp. TaxID=1934404 RepID=UPI00238C4D57|nr:hypothetical protein [Edaphobacter sp.]MDE1175175.1 hypothetical protein [Edaphobacter sp.]